MPQQANTGYMDGEQGELMLAIRKDSATALADADTKFSPLQTDQYGNLRTVQPAAVAGETVYSTIDGIRTSFVADKYNARLLEEILLTLIQIRDHFREKG